MTLLKVLGWIFIPFIMIIIQWKSLNKGLRIIGVIWALIVLIPVLSNWGNEDNLETANISSLYNNEDSKQTSEKEERKKIEAEAKAAREKEKQEAKAAKEKEEAERKAAEEAEYNKPENVYERWVKSQFSSWDGSATALKDMVKESMHNPKSFEHVETKYRDKGDMKGIDVYMKFRGTNAFGGVVTNTIHGSYDYETQTVTAEYID